jgi:FdhD protein
MDESLKSKVKVNILRVEQGQVQTRRDQLATEEPLELRLVDPPQTLAVTMRTPGADFDLAAGFLHSEGIISDRQDIMQLAYCDARDPRDLQGEHRYNRLNITLRPGLQPNLPALERHFFTTSACGVCGKASLETLQLRGYTSLPQGIEVSPAMVYSLPNQLQAVQGLFASTGGLHAAALFDLKGHCLQLREDIGRHNALDKLIGASVLSGDLPWNENIVMVSGRSSFEILQKCIVARVPIVCAVSAPSSLAVTLARAFNITLVGFLRGQRFNVYAGFERIGSESFSVK